MLAKAFPSLTKQCRYAVGASVGVFFVFAAIGFNQRVQRYSRKANDSAALEGTSVRWLTQFAADTASGCRFRWLQKAPRDSHTPAEDSG